jgi:hypothetical protein
MMPEEIDCWEDYLFSITTGIGVLSIIVGSMVDVPLAVLCGVVLIVMDVVNLIHSPF